MLLSKQTEMIGVSVITLTAFVFLSFAFLGQNVHILGDEHTYSFDSQFTAAAEATYPVWLYLSIFSFVSYAGSGFYEAARFLNAAIFALSVPIIYATARHYTTSIQALVIAGVSAIAPINSYVGVFMPDTSYFTAFWIVTWFVLTRTNWSAIPYGLGIGLLAGAAALVKPHGLFLLIAILAMQAAFVVFYPNWSTAKRSAKIVAAALIAFTTIRFGIGYLFAGDSALSLFGAYSQWTSNDWTPEKLSNAAKLGFLLTGVHLAAIAIWVGPGIASLGHLVARDTGSDRHALALYILLFIGLMLTICIVFSVRIADGAPAIDALRIHMRYYNVAFPLFMIAAASYEKQLTPGPIWLVVPVAIVVAGAAAVGMFPVLTEMPFTHLDAPEIRGLVATTPALYIAAAGAVLCSLLVAFRPQIGVRAYLFVLMPFAALCATAGVHGDLRHRIHPTPLDQAALVARGTLAAETSRLSIIGTPWEALNARFQINAVGVGDLGLRPDEAIDPRWISPEADWILMFGDRDRPEGWNALIDRAPAWVILQRD